MHSILKEKNMSKLKYLYYECFNEKENDYDKIILKLKEAINNDNMILKLYNIFNYSTNKTN